MVHPEKHIEDLDNQAIERELVSRLSPDPDTQLKNEQRAKELHKRVDKLKQRIAKLTRDHPER